MKTRRITPAELTEIPATGHLTIVSRTPRQTFELGEFALIGRDPASDICLDDDSISLRHARIEWRKDAFFIRDLRSKNNTILNGATVLEARLSHLDRIRFGETELIFTHNGADFAKSLSLTSKNLKWAEQLGRLTNMAQSQLPILLNGPSGVGKDVLALEIHRNSKKNSGPFISVNCGALSETLIESELFGHIKGSFTGAMNDRKGAFESARNGTIFLDEIGELPLGLQPKLLRALENSEIKPVGGDKPTKIESRVIAATNRNLRQEVLRGNFREDLWFRLNVLQLEPPALKDRMEDFEDLVRFFSTPLRVRFTHESLSQLKNHSWPGNIRELKNTISRASALFPDQAITIKELEQIIDLPLSQMAKAETLPILLQGGVIPQSREAFRQFEREMIIEKLLVNKGNQRQTARDLGLPKSTLHDRLKMYGINPKLLNLGDSAD